MRGLFNNPFLVFFVVLLLSFLKVSFSLIILQPPSIAGVYPTPVCEFSTTTFNTHQQTTTQQANDSDEITQQQQSTSTIQRNTSTAPTRVLYFAPFDFCSEYGGAPIPNISEIV